MAKLCLITIPGLDVRADWRTVHDRLLDDFPKVTDVLATTMSETILITYDGRGDIDAWFEVARETLRTRRQDVRASHQIAPTRGRLLTKRTSRRRQP
jgi:hypothetical protein